jgi:hypothetical protein
MNGEKFFASVSCLVVVAVINSIRSLHTPIKTRCVRVCDRNAGYEVTCFSPTHISYFTLRSFVCVSRCNHITQERGTRHSFLFLVLRDKRTQERSRHLVMWSSYCVLCSKLKHKLWQHTDSQDSSVLIATGYGLGGRGSIPGRGRTSLSFPVLRSTPGPT